MLDLFLPIAHAQTAPANAGIPMGSYILIGIMFAVFFFLSIRPQMKRAKEHREMLSALKVGDEVVTQGGILGKVSQVKSDIIELQIAQNTKINVQQNAITTLLPKGTLKSNS